nr:hypothetical protein [Tanacetum cinerariifolium]
MMPITSVEDKAQRRLEVKAISTLIMGIPNEHQLKFNYTKDAKQLLEATEKRFVNLTNEISTANTQVNAAFSSNIDNLSDDVICAFLASQPNSPQFTHEDLEQIHPDDTKDMDLKWQMAMLTMRARRFLKKTRRKLTINGNETIGFDNSNVKCYNYYKRVHFARECRALKNKILSTKKAQKEVCLWKHMLGYDWSDQAERPNYALMIFTSLSSNSKSVEKRLDFYKKNEFIYLEDINVLKVEIQMKEIAITELKRKLKVAQKEKDGIQLTVEKLENASKSLNKLIDCQIVDNCKKGLGYESYNTVPPPNTGNFMPPKLDLSFTGLDEFAIKPVFENKSSEEETKAVRKNTNAPIVGSNT